MDNQSIYNWIIGGLLAIVGWLGRTIWDAVNSLKEDVKNLEIGLPVNYVRKADIEVRFDKIDNVLERIFDKLEHKADK